MSRVQLSRLRTVALFATGIAAVQFTIVPNSDGLAVTAQVKSSDVGAGFTSVCDDSGKIKKFKDVDDFLKLAAKFSAFDVAVPTAFSFVNQSALDPKPFGGDIIAKNRNTVASYTMTRAALTSRAGTLASTIALMPSNTAAEIAAKAEVQAQKTAVDGQVQWLTSEIDRITLLLPVT
jgi:hypothetical protein